jgi:hypothetical protein
MFEAGPAAPRAVLDIAANRAAADASAEPVLGFGEVTAQPLVVKCMGRTYRAVAVRGEVRITDQTDVTTPVLLGTALAVAGGTWEVRTARGEHLVSTADLLKAVATLREAVAAAWRSSAQRPR